MLYKIRGIRLRDDKQRHDAPVWAPFRSEFAQAMISLILARYHRAQICKVFITDRFDQDAVARELPAHPQLIEVFELHADHRLYTVPYPMLNHFLEVQLASGDYAILCRHRDGRLFKGVMQQGTADLLSLLTGKKNKSVN